VQVWSADRVLLNYTVNEDLVFCPGDVIPWSDDGRLSDEESITNIGLAYQAALYSGNTAIGFTPDDYLVTRPARDWVMGYEDDKLRGADGVRNPIVTALQHNMSVPSQTDWAMPSNQTLQIWTGVSRSLGFAGYMSRLHDSGNAQVCPSFVDSDADPWCEDAWPCPEHMDCPDVETRPETSPDQAEGSQLGYINGSTGQRFPWQPDFAILASEPLNCQHNLSLWVPCLLRSVALYCNPAEGKGSVRPRAIDEGDSEGPVQTRRFRIAPEDAMPWTERPFNAGYDMYGSPWIWNLTAQRQAPIFMSLPHFVNSTFELNTTTNSSSSNVAGLRAPDAYSLPWLDIEIHSGVRLRGAMRLQTNVLITGSTGQWSAPWMVPIGRVSYENNASDAAIRVIIGQAYSFGTKAVATGVIIASSLISTVFLTLSVQMGVKYYEMERGLLKMKNKRLSRTGAMAKIIRRMCGSCGLCGPDRGDIVRRLQEMKQEELLSPLLSSGHSVTPLTSIQEKQVDVGLPTGRRRAATDDHAIEVHFGRLEQMSSDESDEDGDTPNENAHVVTHFDLETWDDLVAPPGRSKPQRCSQIWELTPWGWWWLVGIAAPRLHNWRQLETHALVLAALLSGFVVSSQYVQRLCTAKKDRVFVLVPTIVDISTLAIFSVSAVFAVVGQQQDAHWEPWPAITHGAMLAVCVLCMACGHPFILPVYCRELRPEIWRERIVFRLCEVVSWFWCTILLLITALQTIPIFATHMSSSEQGFLYAWIPIMLLAIAFWFTMWYPMQVEVEFVSALNRLLRKDELRSRRDDATLVDVAPTPMPTQINTPPHSALDLSAEAEVDLRIVPTLSPRNNLRRAEAETQRSRILSPEIPGRRPDVASNARMPKLTLESSVQVSGATGSAVAEVSGASTSMPILPDDMSVEVQPRALQPDVERTMETVVRNPDPGLGGDKDEGAGAETPGNDEVVRKNEEIQMSVSARMYSCSAPVAKTWWCAIACVLSPRATMCFFGDRWRLH
jgi:ribosomal protein S27AE